jgi:hypothetical protein
MSNATCVTNYSIGYILGTNEWKCIRDSYNAVDNTVCGSNYTFDINAKKCNIDSTKVKIVDATTTISSLCTTNTTAGCKSCAGPNKCSTCNDGYYVKSSDGTCATCSSNNIANATKCNEFAATECSAGYVLSGGKCILCTGSTVAINGNCENISTGFTCTTTGYSVNISSDYYNICQPQNASLVLTQSLPFYMKKGTEYLNLRSDRTSVAQTCPGTQVFQMHPVASKFILVPTSGGFNLKVSIDGTNANTKFVEIWRGHLYCSGDNMLDYLSVIPSSSLTDGSRALVIVTVTGNNKLSFRFAAKGNEHYSSVDGKICNSPPTMIGTGSVDCSWDIEIAP